MGTAIGCVLVHQHRHCQSHFLSWREGAEIPGNHATRLAMRSGGALVRDVGIKRVRDHHAVCYGVGGIVLHQNRVGELVTGLQVLRVEIRTSRDRVSARTVGLDNRYIGVCSEELLHTQQRDCLVAGIDRAGFRVIRAGPRVDEPGLNISGASNRNVVFEHEPGLDHDDVAVVQSTDREPALNLVADDAPGVRDGRIAFRIEMRTITRVYERSPDTVGLVVAEVVIAGRVDIPASGECNDAVFGCCPSVDCYLDLEWDDLM